MITRRKTRQITLGTLKVGGAEPRTVQALTKADTRDGASTLVDVRALDAAAVDAGACAVRAREAPGHGGSAPLVAGGATTPRLAIFNPTSRTCEGSRRPMLLPSNPWLVAGARRRHVRAEDTARDRPGIGWRDELAPRVHRLRLYVHVRAGPPAVP